MTIVRRSGILAALLPAVCAALVVSGRAAAAESPAATGYPDSWIESPYRHFGAPQSLSPARAILFDEADDGALRSALSADLRRLYSDLYQVRGWRFPFADDEPLRIYVARRGADGMRRVAARAVQKGKLVSPAILLDGAGLSAHQIAREVGRQIARVTLAGYGVPEDAFLTPALAAALASPADEPLEEELALIAAAPEMDFRQQPDTLGRIWIEEVAREAGGFEFVRQVWERAAASGEPPMPLLLSAFTEATGASAETPLLRCAARLYTGVEPEGAPSRLRLLDLDSGALDASAPAPMSIRHRTLLPPEAEDSLRVGWPEDGNPGAAVVRYRDSDLPPDVVFFAAGDSRIVPLSGVARIDWIVAGGLGAARGIRAPVTLERSARSPFAGLESHAAAAAEGTRLWWTTAAHEGLWGWAVFREEVLPDGRVARAGPELVPSSERAETGFGYVFVDPSTTAGTFYRYTVWAVTDEGLLARAFSATLRTPD